MTFRFKAAICIAALATSSPAISQDNQERPQITLGNGASNMIQIEGLTRSADPEPTAQAQVGEERPSLMRTNATLLTFPKVVSAQPGWIVLHPVIDGRPDGDIVSGYAQLDAGENTDVTIRIPHRAEAGAKYLVMLHKDANSDGVFDFVFVEDGVNVEDTAVFEGTRMIAHIITLPE